MHDGAAAATPGEPFTRQQGLASGLTDRAMRRTCTRLFTGVYVAGSTPVTPLVLARAALLLAPEGAVVADSTAARLWGGAVPHDPLLRVVVGPRSSMDVRGIAARRSQGVEQVFHAGVRVTSPEQTFVDLAARLPLVDLVVLGDSLLRAGVTTRARLGSAAAASSAPGCRLARAAAALVRDRVDSPMETRLRLLLVLAGVPEPVVNHELRDADGRVRFRLDLAFPDVRVAVEYDGRQHAESPQQWRWDIRRREYLDAHGWRLVVVLAPDVFATPGATLDRVVDALRTAGMPARVTSQEWRRHFPGRRAA
ncbi:MAG TPA: DUF559 domain-containing protein [Dermatophilaceae bacterium]|nr:DUF559 domain-containing protein [Dermatophilaceae bacterium]